MLPPLDAPSRTRALYTPTCSVTRLGARHCGCSHVRLWGALAHLLLEPGDIAVKVDAILPGPVGIVPNPFGQLSEVLPWLGLQVSLQQQLSMEGSLKVLRKTGTRKPVVDVSVQSLLSALDMNPASHEWPRQPCLDTECICVLFPL